MDGCGNLDAAAAANGVEVANMPTLTVTTANDEVFDNDGNDATDGDGLSLREALGLAAAGDTIVFADGVDEVFENGALIRLTEGELDIDVSLVIEGGGKVTITGDAGNDDTTTDGLTDLSLSSNAQLDDNSRIFNITSATTLTGLTLTGGSSVDDGGAVYASDALTITDSVFSGNQSGESGGAVYADGTLTVRDSVLSGNEAGSNGGAIAADNALFIENSVVDSNVAVFLGGGVSSNSRSVTVLNSTIDDNTAGAGGGLKSSSSGTVRILYSSISGNRAETTAGGGITNNTGQILLIGSVLNGNLAQGSGGGIRTAGDVTAINSTISGNTVVGSGSYAGAIRGDALTLIQSTVTGNRVNGQAAALFSVTNDISLTNSIILGNRGSSEIATDDGTGAFTSTGVNIVGSSLLSGDTEIGTVTAEEIFDDVAEVGNGTGVYSGVLADNGGSTQTVALLEDASNPALDAGDDDAALVTALSEASLGIDLNGDGDTNDTIDSIDDFAFDQRGNGFDRQADIPFVGGDDTVDLGAFELQSSVADDPSLIVTTTDDDIDPFDGVISLREAIALVNDGTLSGTITFASGAGEAFETGGLIRLTETLEITAGVTIAGDGLVTITGDVNNDDVTVDGITDLSQTSDENSDDNVRIFYARDIGQSVEFSGLTLTGGYAGASLGNSLGGAIRTATETTIRDSVIAGNKALFVGGGVAANNEFLTLIDSTVSGNVSGYNGGGVFSDNGALVIGSTLTDNVSSGQEGGGGGLAATGGVVVVSSVISGNSSSGFYGGGGILAQRLTLIDSTVSDNTTSGSFNSGGGGVRATGATVLINSTISGNSTSGAMQIGSRVYGDGGGLSIEGNATLVNSTISGNSTSGTPAIGGGIAINDGAELTLTNSIVLGNKSIDASDDGDEIGIVSGTVVYSGLNIVGTGSDNDASDFVINGVANDIFAQTANDLGVYEGVLGDNGGTAQTIALLDSTSNPALDAGDDDAPLGITLSESTIGVDLNGDGDTDDTLDSIDDFAFDQRGAGYRRAQDDPNIDNGGTIDLGAVERQEAPSLVVTTANDVVDAFDGVTSLREAIALVADGFSPGTAITFADGANGAFENGATITLTQELTISAETIIEGGGKVTITGDVDGDDIPDTNGLTDVDATLADDATKLGDNVRLFNASADLTLDGLTLTGGRTARDFDGGGAIRSTANIAISDSVLSGNSTAGQYSNGGAIYGQADVRILDSSFSGNSTNSAGSGGGAVYGVRIVQLIGSTLTGNSARTSDGSAEQPVRGGAVIGIGETILVDSTVSDNTATGGYALGAGVFAENTLWIVNSTVSANTTSGTFQSQGAGLFSTDELFLIQSTVSGNHAVGDTALGAGIYSAGGASLINSTVSANVSTGTSAQVGGIWSDGLSGQGISLTNSIVLGNTSTNDGDVQLYQNTSSGAATSYQGLNIVGTGSDSDASDGVINGVANDIFAATEEVSDANDSPTGVFGGVLADNGGDRQTVALKASLDNPALDAGDDDASLGVTLDEATLGVDINSDGD
ncbi:MAG: hypothetical protein AAF674_21615, partial [Pseudomonadota bacterium]